MMGPLPNRCSDAAIPPTKLARHTLLLRLGRLSHSQTQKTKTKRPAILRSDPPLSPSACPDAMAKLGRVRVCNEIRGFHSSPALAGLSRPWDVDAESTRGSQGETAGAIPAVIVRSVRVLTVTVLGRSGSTLTRSRPMTAPPEQDVIVASPSPSSASPPTSVRCSG